MRRFGLIVIFGFAMTVVAGDANAGFMTYYGVDNSPGGSVPAGGNAIAARDNFLSQLSGGIGTEDFESVSGSSSISLAFPGSIGNINATLTGPNVLIQSGPSVGMFATSG